MHRVALIYNAKLPFDMKVMSGVARYRHDGGEFITYIEDDILNNQKIPDLSTWQGDGIIANFDSDVIANAVMQTKLPVVAFGGWYGPFPRTSRIPYFLSDQKLIGYMVADHLLERGFQNFAFCGYRISPETVWGVERQKAFAARVRKHGFACHVYEPDHKNSVRWNTVLSSLGEWLKSLPKPVGIMGAHDRRARQVLEACLEYHLRVPEDVSVVGVDNDEVLCQLTTPELSSLEQDARRIGYDAAALLDRMMSGHKVVRRHFVYKPLMIANRRSSDSFAARDPLVLQALEKIRLGVASGIKVTKLADMLAVSRSSLETRFKQVLGTTVHHTIRKIQLEHARRLVSETNMAMKKIAADTGFRSVQHMTTLFGKTYGKSPARYRRDLAS